MPLLPFIGGAIAALVGWGYLSDQSTLADDISTVCSLLFVDIISHLS